MYHFVLQQTWAALKYSMNILFWRWFLDVRFKQMMKDLSNHLLVRPRSKDKSFQNGSIIVEIPLQV